MITFLSQIATRRVLGGLLGGSLILAGILGLILAFKVRELNSAKEVIQGLTEWQAEMVTTVRLAAGNPDVSKETAKGQVQQLGYDLIELTSTIENQNEAIDQLAATTQQAMKRAQEEKRRRAQAIARAEQLEAKLERQALYSVPIDEMETRVREVQDQLYEAGL